MKYLKPMIVGLSLFLALSGSTALAVDHRVSVCHFSEDEGTYELITVAIKGYENGHSKHAEDFLFDDTLFDEDCVALEVIEEPAA